MFQAFLSMREYFAIDYTKIDKVIIKSCRDIPDFKFFTLFDINFCNLRRLIYILTYMHIYTYIHTYIHTCMHTNKQTNKQTIELARRLMCLLLHSRHKNRIVTPKTVVLCSINILYLSFRSVISLISYFVCFSLVVLC